MAIHRAHRLAGCKEVELSEIAEEPFVLCERSSEPEIYDQTISGCKKSGFSPRVIFHASKPELGLLLASAGIGVALIPASWRSMHAEFLHFAPLKDDFLKTSLALVTRANEHLAIVRVLRKQARAAAAHERPVETTALHKNKIRV